MLDGQRQRDPVGQLEPLLLAHPVHAVDQVEHAALELELRVERRVERDGDAVLRRRPPSPRGRALDEHLVGASSCPAARKPPSVELLELSRCERRAHGAELLAELRAEHRQVRLHAELRRLDRAELDLLHPQLLARSRRRAPAASGAPSTTSRRSGWRSLSPRARPRLAAELDDAPHLRDLGDERRRRRPTALGPAGEEDRVAARPRAPRTRFCHRCSARNGITGAITRSAWTSAYQSVRSAASSPSQKRRRERRMYQFERSSTKRLEGADHVDREERLVARGRLRDELLRSARRASGRAAAARRPGPASRSA